MTEPAQLFATLKQTLRARGVTYRKLARALRMSESGVKKLFASGDCSLGRLLKICDAVGISLEDVAHEAAAANRTPARLTPAQQEFFLANPQCFYYLWELIAHQFDARAVAAAHGLDARTEHRYIVALAAQGCVRAIPLHGSGGVRGVGGFRFGIQLPARLAKSMFHAQQTALLEAARAHPKSADLEDPESLASLGMTRLRVRRTTILELKREIHARGAELEQRSRRDVLAARPDELVDIGLMTVLAPFKLADLVSLADLRIKPAARVRGRAST